MSIALLKNYIRALDSDIFLVNQSKVWAIVKLLLFGQLLNCYINYLNFAWCILYRQICNINFYLNPEKIGLYQHKF